MTLDRQAAREYSRPGSVELNTMEAHARITQLRAYLLAALDELAARDKEMVELRAKLKEAEQVTRNICADSGAKQP